MRNKRSLKISVVFDTNVFISAILFGGNSRLCLELARENKVFLITSRAILLELSQKLYEKFNWKEEEIRNVIAGIGVFAQIVQPVTKIDKIKIDEEDNRILEAAVSGQVDFVVSGDKKHLLALKKFKGAKIVSPADFINKVLSDKRKIN